MQSSKQSKEKPGNKVSLQPGVVQAHTSLSGSLSSLTIQRARFNPRDLTPADVQKLQQTIGNQAVNKLLAQRRAATTEPQVQRSGGDDRIQRFIAHDPPDFQTDNGRAKSVEVENIRGMPLGAGANSPSVNTFGWPELHRDGHTLGNPNSTHYNAVRMHLWNGRLGGPGHDARNLAPGPAQINSSMSAGPEMASKDAVAAGYRVWLRTEVTYAANTGNANDHASVVPNHMEMEWGYMLDDQGDNAMSLSIRPIVGQGPSEPPDWEEDIEPPDRPLTGAEKQWYRSVTSALILDQRLANVSKHEVAQAYFEVSPALQKHMLLKYPLIYEGMQDVDRMDVLSNTLSVAEITHLINTLNLADHKQIQAMVLNNLYMDLDKLESVFNSFHAGLKDALLTYSQWDLLQHLGDTGENLRKNNRRYFNMAPETEQYDLLDQMTAVEIGNLLGGRIDKRLFDNWAKSHGQQKANDRHQFVAQRIPPVMAQNYLDSLRYDIREEAYEARQAKKGGVIRNRKKTGFYSPY